MHFFRDSSVSSVLESSFTPCKLRFSGRCFLALTKKLLFLEVPYGILRFFFGGLASVGHGELHRIVAKI